MTTELDRAHLIRASGSALVWGASAFIAYAVARSVLSARGDVRSAMWIVASSVGVVRSIAVLAWLPGLAVALASRLGARALAGVVMLGCAWLVLDFTIPMLGLIGVTPPMSAAAAAVLILAVVLELAGTIAVAVPMIRGRARPRWLAYTLLVAAPLAVAGDAIAPDGPSRDLATNLASNASPIILAIAWIAFGLQMVHRKGAP